MRSALPRWLRATTRITHMTAAGGWFGTDIALVALGLTHTAIPDLLSEWATFAAGLTIGTGITLAVHPPWGGLRRHHWIGVKIQITGVLVLAGLTSITGMLDAASALTARVCAVVGLVAVFAVSAVKPWRTGQHRLSQPVVRTGQQ